jgi:TolB-like protein
MIDESHRTSDGTTGSFEHSGRKRTIAAAAIIALLLGSFGFVYYQFFPDPPQAILRPLSFQNPALVVLPFTSEDADDERLGIGLADSLTQRLGNLKALTVLSANTGRSVATEPIERISEDLRATFVLRGTLDRNELGAVVDAELVNAPANAVLWKQRFSSQDGDYFAVQTQIAEKMWTTLGIDPVPLERQQVEKSYTKSFGAYEKYLRGRSEMVSRSPASLRRAITLFGEAVEQDGLFAPAYVGLADSYSLLNLYDIRPPLDAYDKALEYANQALALDPDIADAHASLAYIKFYHQRDRSGSELEFRRAIQMNPSYAQAHHWFALVLAAMNKPVDAISEIETAERLDPRSASIRSAAAIVHFFARDFERGLAAADRALELQPNFVPAYKVKRWIFAAQGDWAAARSSFENERRNGGDADAAGWKIIEAQLAPTNDAGRIEGLRLLETAITDDEVRGNDNVYAFEIALAYLHLGDREKAFNWLERSEKARTHSFNLIEPDPRLGEIQSSPRFARLLEKLQAPK